ncbi:MAG: cadherin-like beta sandwich domain-containing protein [Gammaproteobacteria bacterium]|nr:cadherin-like beta sandwich domain-containing protein [Gammaproteobacteria bacterium]
MLKRVFTGLFAAAVLLAGAAAQAQNAPTNLNLTPTTGSESTSLDFSWTLGADGGSGWASHAIWVRAFGADWPTTSSFNNAAPSGVSITGNIHTASNGNRWARSNATSATISGLQPATTYEARIRSADVDGFQAAWSAVVQGVTLSGDTPGKPALSARRITADAGGMTWKAGLQWTAAPDSGTIANFHLRWRTSATAGADGTPGNSDDVAAGTWQNASGDDADCAANAANPENCGEELAASADSYEVTGLTENTAYDFEVRAENSIGAGLWSDTLAFSVEALNTDASLSALVFNDGSADVDLTPDFEPHILSYTASIRSAVENADITPTASDADGAAIKVGRAGSEAAVASGAASSQSINRSGGEAAQDASLNTFRIQVTAEDGTLQTYEIAVSRLQASADASLSALTVSAGAGLLPAFAPETLSYRSFLRNALTGVAFDILPTAAHAGASIKAGRAGFLAGVASGQRSRQGYDESGGTAGNTEGNIFLIEVTAEDGETTRTYTIQLIRQARSSDSTLRKLEVSDGELQPAFSPGVTSYYVAVGNNVAQFGVTPTATPRDPLTSSITVGRAGFPGGVGSGATSRQGTEVGGGNNVFLVVVTSEDSSSITTYTLDVFRAGAISKLLIHDASVASASRNDANSLLATSAFDPLVPAYSLMVQRAVTAVVITPTITAGGVNYQRTKPTVTPASAAAITSGTASDPVPLAGGENLILVKVHTADYPLTVIRPPDAPANLGVAVQSEKLLAHWDAPQGAARDYRVRWRLKDAGGGAPGAWQSASGDSEDGEAAGAAAFYRILGLADGSAYQVAVRGDNAAGSGEWSAAVEATPGTGLEFAAQQADLAFVAGSVAAAVTLQNAAGGTSSLTFALTGLPPGLAFDEGTREISGTPSAAAAPVEVFYMVTDSGAGRDQQRFRVGVLDSYANVAEDGAAGVNPADGILIARYLLGARGASLAAGQSELRAARLEAAVQAGVHAGTLDVDGDGGVDEVDGILIARYLLGLRGADLVAGFSGLNAVNIEIRIADLLP